MSWWDEQDWIDPAQWVMSGVEVMGTTPGMCWVTNIVTKDRGLFKPESRWRRSAYGEYGASKLAAILEIPCAKVIVGELFGGGGCISFDVSRTSEYRVLVGSDLYLCGGLLNLEQSQVGDLVYDDPDEMSFLGLRPYLPANAETDMVRMMFFDCVTMNGGRHSDNYSFEVDARCAIRGMLPLYDHGWCFQEHRFMGRGSSFPYFGRRGFLFEDLYVNIKRDYPELVAALASKARSDEFRETATKLEIYDFITQRVDEFESLPLD